MLLLAITWLVIHAICGAISIILLGDRQLISGSLLSWENLLRLILSWKFYVSFLLAFFARFSFMQVNHYLLRIPSLADNSTTITTFAAALTYLFVVISAAIFLQERISWQQAAGASLILLGIVLIMR